MHARVEAQTRHSRTYGTAYATADGEADARGQGHSLATHATRTINNNGQTQTHTLTQRNLPAHMPTQKTTNVEVQEQQQRRWGNRWFYHKQGRITGRSGRNATEVKVITQTPPKCSRNPTYSDPDADADADCRHNCEPKYTHAILQTKTQTNMARSRNMENDIGTEIHADIARRRDGYDDGDWRGREQRRSRWILSWAIIHTQIWILPWRLPWI